MFILVCLHSTYDKYFPMSQFTWNEKVPVWTAMIELSIRFKRTFYQSLSPVLFQVGHANRYQLNFWKN